MSDGGLEHQCGRTLGYLGYSDLDAYFESKEWLEIQAQFLLGHGRCAHCSKPAVLVRIKSYTIKVLKGGDPSGLEAICLSCVDGLEVC